MDSEPDEIERLRRLVGPSERSYESLRADRDAAQRVARDARAEVGELRGRIEEMRVQLARARQDQDVLLQQAAMRPVARTLDRLRRRVTTSVVPRLTRLDPRK